MGLGKIIKKNQGVKLEKKAKFQNLAIDTLKEKC